jgi:hypothetical protein
MRAMDPLTALLCGLGAVMVSLGGGSGSASDALALGAGLYGVHRATQKGIGRVLVAVPALLWMLAHFWKILPEAADRFQHGAWSMAPSHLASFMTLGLYFATVVLARQKIGTGLAGLTMGALGFASFVAFLALFTDSGSTPDAVLHQTASGWGHVAITLTSVCWLVLGLGPITVPALPRSLGAIAGAVGASLLAALVSGAGSRGEGSSTMRLLVLLALFLGWVLAAFGPGALARAGAGPVAWTGVGLIVVQVVFGLPGAAFLDEATGRGSMGGMPITAMGLGLLGLALTALAARSIGLDKPRSFTAVLLLVGVFGAMQLWFGYMLLALRVYRRNTPGWPVEILSRPAMTLGLVLWAACLVFLALPPAAQPSMQSST